jgi:hypothetical protein
MNKVESLAFSVLCLVLAPLACRPGNDAPRTHSAQQPDTARSSPRVIPDSAIDSVIGELALLEGQFSEDAPNPGHFAGDRALFHWLGEQGNAAAFRLVECLSDTTLARATWQGRRLSLGMMCYVALQGIAYYEPVDERGEIRDDWDGWVSLGASAVELRRAQAAWREVGRGGRYLLL